tara:strand:- start:222 stop:479 length:258 start_codon:yes stop_codon:yes gene_type:complete
MECDECKRLNALCEFYANDDDLAWHGCHAHIESCQDGENCPDYQQACDCACQRKKQELNDDEIHEAIVKHTARAVNIILGKEDKK